MPMVPLAQLLGQSDVATFLRGVVGRGRYANAYLFHGPAGVGKGTAALAFARAALCDRVPGAAPAAAAAAASPSLFEAAPAPAAAPATGDDACGACPACVKSATLRHPDLKFLFPIMADEKRKLDDDELVAFVLDAWREDPLYAFQYDRFASIRIDMTRTLLRELAYRPYEAARRVVVVRDCDRMREDQYSALLKSIEEPGATTVWVLTTARLTRVPVTIRSRCQRVRFAPLPESLVTGVLTGPAAVPPGKAALLAALAGGSLARALTLRELDSAETERNGAIALLDFVQKGDPGGLWLAVAAAARGGSKRESLRRLLEYHALWLRDLLRARFGAPAEALVHRGHEARIRELAATTDVPEIRRRLMVLEEALRAIDGNVSAELTLFSTLARVAGSRMGENAWPAHATPRWDY